MKKLIVFNLILVILLSPLAAAQEELPDPGITPDSFLYGLKRVFESIDLFFTFNKLAVAEKKIKYAELRLSEAKAMSKKGKSEFVKTLIKEYEENLNSSADIVEEEEKKGKNVTKLTELISLKASRHIEVLQEVLEKVPEQAKSAIEKAINVSSRGMERALKVLERTKPEKAVKLRLKIAEKKLEKAEKMIAENKTKQAEKFIILYEKIINKTKIISEKTNVTKTVENATAKHIKTLEKIYEKAPEHAKQSVKKAITISSKIKAGPVASRPKTPV